MIVVSDHAVDRFVERWRPGIALAEARAELEAIVADAGPTKQRTLTRDAQLWLGITRDGERIGLAVRDGVVVTVLPRRGEGQDLVDMSATEDLADESRATVEACRAMVRGTISQTPFSLAWERGQRQAREIARAENREKSRRLNAQKTLDEAKNRYITPAAIERAKRILGIE